MRRPAAAGPTADLIKTVGKDIPQDWIDLLEPEYRGKIAPSGGPGTANRAIMTAGAVAISRDLNALSNPDIAANWDSIVNVGSNFAGVPLALAIIAAFGRVGMITVSISTASRDSASPASTSRFP